MNDTTTVLNNCGARKAVTPNTVAADNTGTDINGAFEFKAYPNPFSNLAFVEFRMPESSFVTVQVYNNLGISEKILFNNKVTPNQWYKLALSGSLPAGIHYFTIRFNNKLYSRKLVSVK